MTIQEIKNQICDLRFTMEELADECFTLWQSAEDNRTESVADYLHYELTAIAAHLSDLEDTDAQESEKVEEGMEEINDWWDNLDNVDKSEISNTPQPTTFDGRGEYMCEFEDRVNKWWESRTNAQKREIYEDNMAWWDKE